MVKLPRAKQKIAYMLSPTENEIQIKNKLMQSMNSLLGKLLLLMNLASLTQFHFPKVFGANLTVWQNHSRKSLHQKYIKSKVFLVNKITKKKIPIIYTYWKNAKYRDLPALVGNLHLKLALKHMFLSFMCQISLSSIVEHNTDSIVSQAGIPNQAAVSQGESVTTSQEVRSKYIKILRSHLINIVWHVYCTDFDFLCEKKASRMDKLCRKKKLYPMMLFFFLRVSGGSDKIHKVLKPFNVLDVRGPQVFQAVRRAKDVTIEDYMIGRLLLSATDTFGCI